MGRFTRAATALAVAVVMGACGGSDATEPSAKGEQDQAEAPAPAAVDEGGKGSGQASGRGSGQAADKGATATTARSSGGGGSQSSGSPPAKGDAPGEASGSAPPGEESKKEPTPLEASLTATCVRAGGQQTIRVKVPPGSGVAYNSYYSDGKSGLHEGFYGGNKGHLVDSEDGTWSDTWTVAPNAPPGKVRVAVLAGHMDYEPAERDLFFDLVPSTGTCP